MLSAVVILMTCSLALLIRHVGGRLRRSGWRPLRRPGPRNSSFVDEDAVTSPFPTVGQPCATHGLVHVSDPLHLNHLFGDPPGPPTDPNA